VVAERRFTTAGGFCPEIHSKQTLREKLGAGTVAKMQTNQTLQVVRTTFACKALIVLSFFIAFAAKFNTAAFLSAYAHWPLTESPTVSSRLGAWDAAHYLILSQTGYQAGSHSCAFYPLWPGLIHAASILTFGRPLLAALLLANALSLLAFWLFYHLVKNHFGEMVGKNSLILLLAFPSAFFFSFPYTESLYLVMVLACFLELERGHYALPALTAFLMPLTKAIGVFMVFPIIWHLYEQKKACKYWLLLLAPLLGYAAYFGVMYAQTGNAFEGFAAQKEYPNSPSIKNMFNVPGIFAAAVNIQSVDGMMDSALDRGFFLLFLALLPLVYKLNKTWFFYTLPAGLVPALTSWFMSYRRYIMVCFPIFIVLAQLLQKTNPKVFWYYVILLAGLQVWAIIQFTNFNWAG